MSATATKSEAPAPAAATAKKAGKGKLVAVAVLLVVAGAGGAYYNHARHYEETDDAQVDGDISAVSPKVAGNLKVVNVIENQQVKAGDVIAEIESAEFEIAVAQAKAQVGNAEAQLRAEEPGVAMTETTNDVALQTSSSDVGGARADLAGAEATLKQTEAQLIQSQANEKLALADLERSRSLIASGSISSAELDQRTAAADAARAATAALTQARLAAAERVNQSRSRLNASSSRVTEVQRNGPRQVTTRKASVEIRQANLDLARAQLRQAELNLGYTKILAPVSGIVGKKSINVGDRVQPGQQLVAITQADRLWVTANFRETQLRTIRTGQSVTMHVDAFDAELNGTIESIGGATGSRYSLLPPENATGNYVKVVQRIPVRIAITPGQSGLDALRPGLSVEPSVKVR
jgi:membrane fusion protein (multidrug efflux system)